MIIELTYQLYGYINYTKSAFGFVTPVFVSKNYQMYVQVSSGPNCLPIWSQLDESYHEKVIKATFELKTVESFVYGFKKGDYLYFADGKGMAIFLSLSYSPGDDGYELAKEFILDWPSLEPVIESFTKVEIWNKCLELIGLQSRTMPAIFREQLEVIDYSNGMLILKSKSINVQKLFETKFKQHLLNHFDKIIFNFQIEFVKDDSNKLPALPFIYFGGGEQLYTQGSYFLETRISPFQNFDNFIVSDFNLQAYHQALEFTSRKTPSVLTIQGAAGVGKTHLVHSIAKLLSLSNRNVGVYTVFSQPGSSHLINEPQIKQIEESAAEKDVIIIDDAHNIKNADSSWIRMVHLLKKWKEMNKSIVLSHRDNLQVDIIPEIQVNVDKLYLALPDEADKLSIIESRTNDLNIQIPKEDVVRLTEDNNTTIADIQKFFAKTYLFEEIKHRTQSIFYFSNFDHIQPKRIETCVYEYFNFIPYSFTSKFIQAKVISNFIQDILITSHHGSNIHTKLPYVDGLYYSFDTLQHFVFENQEFRRTLSNILMKLAFYRDGGTDGHLLNIDLP